MMALVASLWVELAALYQCVDNQECLGSHNEGDGAEDEDERPAVRHCLGSFWCFVTDTLPDYILQPDPSGHVPCAIALASLDRLFEGEHRLRTVDMQLESALPLSSLLLGVQSFLDRYLQGRHEEDPGLTSQSLSQPLSFPEGIGQSESVVSISPSRRCLGVTHRVIGSGLRRNIGSLISWCRLWWPMISPSFRCSPLLTSIPQLRS